MKLQLALDVLDTNKAKDLAQAARDYIDIIEIGTPLLKYEGISVLQRIRSAFPEKTVFVDLKTMDVGEYEADFCFDNGADIVSVLGVAHIETIKGTIKSARRNNGRVLVDMINHPDIAKRAMEVEAAGADYVGIHSGIDQQKKGISPLADLKTISKVSKIPIFVAGGINLSNINDIIKENPETIIVGGSITSSENPGLAAKKIKECFK